MPLWQTVKGHTFRTMLKLRQRNNSARVTMTGQLIRLASAVVSAILTLHLVANTGFGWSTSNFQWFTDLGFLQLLVTTETAYRVV